LLSIAVVSFLYFGDYPYTLSDNDLKIAQKSTSSSRLNATAEKHSGSTIQPTSTSTIQTSAVRQVAGPYHRLFENFSNEIDNLTLDISKGGFMTASIS